MINITRYFRNEVLHLKRMWPRVLSLILLCIIMLTGCSSNSQKVISLEVWHHFDGAQKRAFDKMVTEFNQTEGLGKGIVVEAFSQGSIDELRMKIVNTKKNKIGLDQLPDITSAYAETVEEFDKIQIVVNLEDYVKKGEIKMYDDPYIDESYIGLDQKFKLFPIAKSTDVIMINKTDWEKFSYALGLNLKDLETWEGIVRVADKYYDWTNKQSSKPEDGKAFFAMDNMANYVLAGAKQLGLEIFEIDDNRAVININNNIMKKLWDNYYIPYINGFYGPFGAFSSDDLKTGKILAYVGPIEQGTYFPKDIATEDNTNYDIEQLILPIPNFASTEPVAALRGIGMAILKSKDAQQRAAVEFLRWFVDPINNIEFSLTTGYLPVSKASGNAEAIVARLKKGGEQIPKEVKKILPVAAKQVGGYDMHVQKSFNKSSAARDVLATSLTNRAKVDREKVLELIGQGMSRTDAVAIIGSEINFEQWVVRFKMELKGVIKLKLQ